MNSGTPRAYRITARLAGLFGHQVHRVYFDEISNLSETFGPHNLELISVMHAEDTPSAPCHRFYLAVFLIGREGILS
jgi:hypothetical protein